MARTHMSRTPFRSCTCSDSDTKDRPLSFKARYLAKQGSGSYAACPEEKRMAQPSAESRYHALDALRAAMMFLGIYLHAAAAYSPHGDWHVKPAEGTTALDYTISWIHVFRMPVFYVMAGFFAALLLDRYGLPRAANNRFWRIAVPFVVGWVVLYPIYSFLLATDRAGLSRAVDYILSG